MDSSARATVPVNSYDSLWRSEFALDYCDSTRRRCAAVVADRGLPRRSWVTVALKRRFHGAMQTTRTDFAKRPQLVNTDLEKNLTLVRKGPVTSRHHPACIRLEKRSISSPHVCVPITLFLPRRRISKRKTVKCTLFSLKKRILTLSLSRVSQTKFGRFSSSELHSWPPCHLEPMPLSPPSRSDRRMISAVSLARDRSLQ